MRAFIISVVSMGRVILLKVVSILFTLMGRGGDKLGHRYIDV